MVDETSGADRKDNAPGLAPNAVPDVVSETVHTGPAPKSPPIKATVAGQVSHASHAGCCGGGISADAPAAEPVIRPPARQGSQIAKQLIGLVLAAVCVWFAFKGIDLSQVWAALQKVDMLWVGALVVSTLISHWLRAVRWVIMLQPLAQHKISVWNSFCAVMFGYAVNIPIPRGGEVARVVAISKSENISWVGVVPTLLIDRLLDFALLVLMVGLTLAVLPADLKQHVGFLVPAGVLMCVATVIGLVLLPKSAAILRAIVALPAVQQRLPAKLKNTLVDLAKQFEQGTLSLNKPINLLSIGILSFLIWGSYFLNFYCCLLALGLQHQVDLLRSFIVWTISSVSVIAPTPGCVGTYHIATKQALNMVAGVPPTEALALATLSHGVGFVAIPVVVAAICFGSQYLVNKRRQAA